MTQSPFVDKDLENLRAATSKALRASSRDFWPIGLGLAVAGMIYGGLVSCAISVLQGGM